MRNQQSAEYDKKKPHSIFFSTNKSGQALVPTVTQGGNIYVNEGKLLLDSPNEEALVDLNRQGYSVNREVFKQIIKEKHVKTFETIQEKSKREQAEKLAAEYGQIERRLINQIAYAHDDDVDLRDGGEDAEVAPLNLSEEDLQMLEEAFHTKSSLD